MPEGVDARGRRNAPNHRACGHCGASLMGKRPHALYCDRTCKTKASHQRSREDGRARAQDRARYQRDREKRIEAVKVYMKGRPDYYREIRRRRKAMIRGGLTSFTYTARDWRRTLERYGWRCAYCGVAADVLQQEHVIPVSRGGKHSTGNIVPACAPCNYSKGKKTVMEWRMQRVRSTS